MSATSLTRKSTCHYCNNWKSTFLTSIIVLKNNFQLKVQTGSGPGRGQHDGCEEALTRNATTKTRRGDEGIKTEKAQKRHEGEGEEDNNSSYYLNLSQNFRWKIVLDSRRRWTGQPCCYFPSYF